MDTRERTQQSPTKGARLTASGPPDADRPTVSGGRSSLGKDERCSKKYATAAE